MTWFLSLKESDMAAVGGGYPPNCPDNGQRHFNFMFPDDAWPGDTCTDVHGNLWSYSSDGTGWRDTGQSDSRIYRRVDEEGNLVSEEQVVENAAE